MNARHRKSTVGRGEWPPWEARYDWWMFFWTTSKDAFFFGKNIFLHSFTLFNKEQSYYPPVWKCHSFSRQIAKTFNTTFPSIPLLFSVHYFISYKEKWFLHNNKFCIISPYVSFLFDTSQQLLGVVFYHVWGSSAEESKLILFFWWLSLTLMVSCHGPWVFGTLRRFSIGFKLITLTLLSWREFFTRRDQGVGSLTCWKRGLGFSADCFKILRFHDFFNRDKIPSSRRTEVSPHHFTATTVFDCGSGVLWLTNAL